MDPWPSSPRTVPPLHGRRDLDGCRSSGDERAEHGRARDGLHRRAVHGGPGADGRRELTEADALAPRHRKGDGEHQVRQEGTQALHGHRDARRRGGPRRRRLRVRARPGGADGDALAGRRRRAAYVVMSESFTGNIFKQSFKPVFARDSTGQYLRMAFGATLEVLTSAEFKVCGAIGNCSSLNKKSPNVAETEIGQGNTNAWAVSGLDEDTTLALYFEVTNQANAPVQQGQQRFLQLLTSYQHSSGQYPAARDDARAHVGRHVAAS